MVQLHSPHIRLERHAVRSGSSKAGGTGKNTARTGAVPQLFLSRPSISAAQREEIARQVSFLKENLHSVHSIILVGSAAYSARAEGSDIDIVVITTASGHEKICSLIFAKEIDAALADTPHPEIEYTVLSPGQTEELFQQSSPFSFSIRHGAVIHDDGYLLLLRNKKFPMLPQKEYYATAFSETIVTLYFGTLKKLRDNARQQGCSPSCCRDKTTCGGLEPVHLFAKLLMRMFYMTLPSRGMIPLTKDDVATFAAEAYGPKGKIVADKAVSLLRNTTSASLYFDDLRILKKFAVQMFREILNIVGSGNDMRQAVMDAAKMAQGDYGAIRGPALKNCVV